MKTRLEGLVESFIVIAILLAIYWIVGFIIFKLFKKEIRNDKGYWKTLEAYIEKHSNAIFSHGICENCFETLYKDKGWFKNYKENLKKKSDDSMFGENL